MIAGKRLSILTACCLMLVTLGRGQGTFVFWSSFSQSLAVSSGPGTHVASLVGFGGAGSSSGETTRLIGGFLAGISHQSTVTGLAEESSVPVTYELHQNYPNPFNPTTTIAYDLPAFSRVTIHVFNIVGQHIATLVDQEQPPGRYRLVWDGRVTSGAPAASGVYFYRITARERSGEERQFTSTRKFLLLK